MNFLTLQQLAAYSSGILASKTQLLEAEILISEEILIFSEIKLQIQHKNASKRLPHDRFCYKTTKIK